ncbi:MAG: AAA family ATPase [Bdellovibrionales bacterium]|nr:AAA family ATPase [Bdellovibrionales bacterium]
MTSVTSVGLAGNFMIFIQITSIFVGYLFYPCSVRAEVPNKYREILNTVSGSNRPNLDSSSLVEAINDLKQFRYSESFVALCDRYLVELERLDKGGDAETTSGRPDIFDVLNRLVDAIEDLATVHNTNRIFDLREATNELLQAQTDDILKGLPERFDRILNSVNERRTRLPSAAAKPETSEAFSQELAPESSGDDRAVTPEVPAHKLVLDRLDSLEKALKERIKGQPEAVQALVNAESELLIYGRRKKPKVVVLVGPDGTGKETIAKAYTDVLHGYEGAHEKHMFRVPILKRHADLWQVMGAVVGHEGAGKFPHFLAFLAEHSGGRYQVKKRIFLGGNTETYLEEDQNWDPKTVPERGIVFLDGFQNWSSDMKDAFLAQALDTGIFQLNNPTPELSSISVPITFIISTTVNGDRDGRPLSFDQMMEKWRAVGNDPARIRKDLAASHGPVNVHQQGENRGFSQSLLNSFPDDSLVRMRPLGPETLQEIVRQRLQELSESLSAGGAFGKFSLQWSEKLVRFLQEYHYVAENNASPINSRIADLVKRTLTEAFRSGRIEVSDHPRAIHLDVEENPDRTFDLLFKLTANENENENGSPPDRDQNRPAQEFRLRITVTEIDKPKEPISDARIRELLKIPGLLNQRVFGIERVVDRLGTALLTAEESRTGGLTPDTATSPATIFMFVGPPGNGKTQTGKEIAKILGVEPKTIDCSQIQSVSDVKARILGMRDSLGNSVSSEFMKVYDRSNGRLVVILDEIVNAKNALTVLPSLYDILAEPVVRTFTDGEPRVMTHVTFVMTGNVGEGFYGAVPTNIPDINRQAAFQDIHEMMMKDPEKRRRLLERFLTPAFLRRVGFQNIFFYGPLNFKAIRGLFQLKMMEEIERLKPQSDRRGWYVQFRNKESFLRIIEAFEDNGYRIEEQGSSIDLFVKQDFGARLRELLHHNLVSTGSKVVLDFDPVTGMTRDTFNEDVRILHLRVDIFGEPNRTDSDSGKFDRGTGVLPSKTLWLTLKGKETPDIPTRLQVDEVLTAFHEAGHEVVRKVLFGNTRSHKRITLKPGVTEIGEQIVYFLGEAVNNPTKELTFSRAVVLREIAAKFGGDVAQSLLTKGGSGDAGKSNDLERATSLAQTAILRWGLSKKWGPQTMPSDPNVSMESYIAGLPEERKKLLSREVNQWMAEGRELARRALLANLDNLVIPLGSQLLEKLTMEREDLDKFYETHQVFAEGSPEYRNPLRRWTGTALRARLSPFIHSPSTLVPELLPGISTPESVADISSILKQHKEMEVSEVALPPDLPVFEKTNATAGGGTCRSAVLKKAQ